MRPLPTLHEIRAERRRRELLQEADETRKRCRSLAGFVKEAWHVLEPTATYIHGWHIDFICEHLEAITDGRLPPRLLINVPPGTMKSLLVSVLWPAWEWGPRELASLRYLTTSYSESYVKRDARRMRDLINSEWYQAHWPVSLVREAEISFENTARGYREGRPFAGLTGGRGDRVIVDDPHSTETAESEAERARTTRIFRESVPLRLNDPVKSAIVIIMQRLHADDVAGVALALKLGYVHIMLPMEFEPERRCVTPLGQDPRTDEGELLFPDRFPKETIERDKVPLGTYGVAGQFQQRPAPREGGLFKRAWFGEPIPAAPSGTRWVRHWDLAASRRRYRGGSQAATAGVKLGRAPDGTFYVGHVIRTFDEGSDVRKLIKTTAATDGRGVAISLPQDPGQAGKVQAHDLVSMLAGYVVHATPETGDKVTRAEPVAAQAAAGNVKLVAGDWNEPFLDELAIFPAGHHKDQVDALSAAFGRLIQEGPAVFRAALADCLCEPFRVPPHWPSIYAVDLDWGKVSVLWGAWDREAATLYLYREYSAPRQKLALHAAEIRTLKLPEDGLIDPTAHDRTREDGSALIERLYELGVELLPFELDGERELDEMQKLLETGRLRVFDTLEHWANDYSNLRRDERGRVDDAHARLIHCTRLLLAAGMVTAAQREEPYDTDFEGGGRSSVTGY